MPRSACIKTIDPEMISQILTLLKSKGQAFKYESENAVYIKEYSPGENGTFSGLALIDIDEDITTTVRVDGEVQTQSNKIKKVVSASYVYKPSIESEVAGKTIEHAIIFIGDAWTATLFFDAVYKALKGKMPFRKVNFIFNSSNEASIRAQFGDIIRIRGDEIVDHVVSGLAISGVHLSESQEYQKVLSGEIRYIGVPLGDDKWFMLNSSGRITTYRSPSDKEFLESVGLIMSKLLCADAVK